MKPQASPPATLLRPGVPAWVAVLIACIASFMVVMDGAIVNVALPSMRAELGLSAVQQPWVVDAYLLCLGGFTLLAARASDLWGRRPVLSAGLLLFTGASLAGGLADSPALLLAARALQGLGGAALATSTLAVIVAVYPGGPARGRAISWWAASSALAVAMGVVLGGVLTAWAGWRWVMFVNVPLGLGLCWGVRRALARPAPGASAPRLDLPGAVSVTAATGSLMLGISQAASLGWRSVSVLGALAAAGLLLLAFWRIESRSSRPLIRLGVFAERNVSLGNLVVMGLGACLTASTYFCSLVLQQGLGQSVLQAGLQLLPMSLALAVAAMASRALMDAGVRHLPFYGGVVGALGLAWLSWRLQALGLQETALTGPTVVTGLGLGLMLMTATHTALDGVPAADLGLASGLFNTARQLGAALGLACLSTLAHAAAPGLLAGCAAAFMAAALLSLAAGSLSLLLRPRPA
ncbi:MFS transporter [Paucibacter soli]|uniref:MFS transporter n=1 Tax=Paucibacter soli TaxID=3133433 RepID=UPI0030ACE802